jgi:hypothetical protein
MYLLKNQLLGKDEMMAIMPWMEKIPNLQIPIMSHPFLVTIEK